MILTEYDQERHMKLVQKNSEERGRQEGRLEGHDEINRLNRKLLAENRMEDMKRAMIDSEFQRQLLAELEEEMKKTWDCEE